MNRVPAGSGPKLSGNNATALRCCPAESVSHAAELLLSGRVARAHAPTFFIQDLCRRRRRRRGMYNLRRWRRRHETVGLPNLPPMSLDLEQRERVEVVGGRGKFSTSAGDVGKTSSSSSSARKLRCPVTFHCVLCWEGGDGVRMMVTGWEEEEKHCDVSVGVGFARKK